MVVRTSEADGAAPDDHRLLLHSLIEERHGDVVRALGVLTQSVTRKVMGPASCGHRISTDFFSLSLPCFIARSSSTRSQSNDHERSQSNL